jgi:hypothetical protein
MGFNRRKMEDQRRGAAEREAAGRRATDAQVLETNSGPDYGPRLGGCIPGGLHAARKFELTLRGPVHGPICVSPRAFPKPEPSNRKSGGRLARSSSSPARGISQHVKRRGVTETITRGGAPREELEGQWQSGTAFERLPSEVAPCKKDSARRGAAQLQRSFYKYLGPR